MPVFISELLKKCACGRNYDEFEPLPEDEEEEEEEEDEDSNNNAMVITEQPQKSWWFQHQQEEEQKQKQKQKTVLCCSTTEEAKVGQVDLCPRIWIREFDSPEEAPPSWQSQIWRVCFFLTCLPVCYPCYLSRSYRRKGKQVLKAQETVNKPKTILETLDDTMERTMQRQVAQFQQISTVAAEIKENVIDINVILLHSGSSEKVKQYLATARNPLVDDKPKENCDKTHQQQQQPEQQQTSDDILRVPPQNNQRASSTSSISSHRFSHLSILHEDHKEDENGKEVEAVDEVDGRSRRREMKRLSRLSSITRNLSRSVSMKSRRISFRKSKELENSSSSSSQQKQQQEQEESIISWRRRSSASSCEEFFDALSALETEEGEEDTKSTKYSYYSCDKFQRRRRRRRQPPPVRSPKLEMKSLGSRTIKSDLGYRLRCSIFDEGSVADWRGEDLGQLDQGSIDILILTFSRGKIETELSEILNSDRGILSYVTRFWKGFYPLLLIELRRDDDGEEVVEANKGDDVKLLNRIYALFGDVHHIKIDEKELFSSAPWINECLSRLYLHSRLYQCSRFYGKGVNSVPKCPGGCELSKFRKRGSPLLKRKVRSKLRVIYRFSKASASSTSASAVAATANGGKELSTDTS